MKSLAWLGVFGLAGLMVFCLTFQPRSKIDAGQGWLPRDVLERSAALDKKLAAAREYTVLLVKVEDALVLGRLTLRQAAETILNFAIENDSCLLQVIDISEPKEHTRLAQVARYLVDRLYWMGPNNDPNEILQRLERELLGMNSAGE